MINKVLASMRKAKEEEDKLLDSRTALEKLIDQINSNLDINPATFA